MVCGLTQSVETVDRIDCTGMGNEQLETFIGGVCRGLVQHDQLDQAPQVARDCYTAIRRGNEVSRSKMIVAAESLLEFAKRAGNKIACLILDKVCEILDMVEDIEETVCDKFNQTWTILAEMSQPDLCDIAIPITEPMTIFQSGLYCLAHDISTTLNAGITIVADNVILDLNTRRISGAGINVVIINGFKDVIVKNGILSGGVVRNLDSFNNTNVLIQDISFADSPEGALINSSTCVQIERCTFRNHSTAGIIFDGATKSLVVDNKVVCNGGNGIIFQNNTLSSVISQNFCSNNTNGIAFFDTFDSVINENILTDNSADGMVISGISTRNTICKDISQGNGGDGLSIISTSSNNLVVENKVSNNGALGIEDNNLSNKYANNIATNNAGGAYSGSVPNQLVFGDTMFAAGFNLKDV